MRRTTTAKLQKIISDNFVSVTSAVVNYDDKGVETSSVDKLKEDLELYANSGVFVDTLDFTFEKISEDKLHIAIGKMSSYCYDNIDVTLQLNDSVRKIISIKRECIYRSIRPIGKRNCEILSHAA